MPRPADDKALEALRTVWQPLLRAGQRAATELTPDDKDRLLGEFAELVSRLYDNKHVIMANTKRHEKFWSRLTCPPSDRTGLDAPCWPTTFAMTKTGPIASWESKLQPVPRIVWQLLRGEPLGAHRALRKLCKTPNCVNALQHFQVERRRRGPTALRDPDFVETLTQAVEADPLCSRGHALKNGQAPKDCSECRLQRRHAQQQARGAEWRGQIEDAPHTPPPTPPTIEEDDEFDLNARIDAMFQPTPVSNRILAIHNQSSGRRQR